MKKWCSHAVAWNTSRGIYSPEQGRGALVTRDAYRETNRRDTMSYIRYKAIAILPRYPIYLLGRCRMISGMIFKYSPPDFPKTSRIQSHPKTVEIESGNRRYVTRHGAPHDISQDTHGMSRDTRYDMVSACRVIPGDVHTIDPENVGAGTSRFGVRYASLVLMPNNQENNTARKKTRAGS